MKYDVTKKPTRGAQRTLDAFSRAWLELVAEQPFERVTVNELCRRAGYPRATFYNYFDDKFDLLDYGWSRVVAHLRVKEDPSMGAEESLHAHFDRAYGLCASHLDVVRRTLACNEDSGYLLSRLRGVVRAEVRAAMRACPARMAGPVPPDLIADHFANTLLLVLEWSLLGERPCTKERAHSHLHHLLAGV